VSAAEALSPLIPADLEARVQRILTHLSAAGRRLATAESCTGGLLASLCTDVPGCSGVFERGVVTYDPQAKVDLLGLDPDLLEATDAVSAEVAAGMAEGLLRVSPADVAVSVTGFAGSGREPGLVHIAVAVRDGATTGRELRFGAIGRAGVRLGTLEAVVQLLDELVLAGGRSEA
jgi:nicotinamide-nucleotide amidase